MSGARPFASAALVALVLTLVACSERAQQPAQSPGQSPSGSPSAAANVRVGLVYTTSGQGGDLAGAVLGATKLATDDLAEAGVNVAVTELDYGGDVARLGREIGRLAGSVDAIVVGTDDNDVAGVLDAGEVPVLHPFVTADAAVGPERPSAFRLAPSNALQAQKLVRFLTGHRKYRRIALIADDTPFGKEGRANLAAALREAGVAPVRDLAFTPGRDVHGVVADAGGANPQAAIVWVESAAEAARVVLAVHKLNYAFQIALSGNLATATFAKNATAQVSPVAFRDGMLSVGTWAGPWFREERIIRFYRAFQQQNSALAPPQAAAVYDAVAALGRAASARGAGSLVAGLESLTDFAAAGVPVTFAPGKREGVDLDDLAVYGFTKDQSAPGGEFQPDVDTGGGFFSVVHESLDLPDRYAYLARTG